MAMSERQREKAVFDFFDANWSLLQTAIVSTLSDWERYSKDFEPESNTYAQLCNGQIEAWSRLRDELGELVEEIVAD